jgi:hypothetical protein
LAGHDLQRSRRRQCSTSSADKDLIDFRTKSRISGSVTAWTAS